MINLKFPLVKDTGKSCADFVIKFKRYKPRLSSYTVKWTLTTQRRLKYSTDGASKVNPGQRAYGFVVRRDDGNLVYAQAYGLGITTNMISEMVSIQAVVRFCALRNLRDMEMELDSLALFNIV